MNNDFAVLAIWAEPLFLSKNLVQHLFEAIKTKTPSYRSFNLPLGQGEEYGIEDAYYV
jgi:hypothetical protein